jgi:hypothetical protein
LRLWALQRAAGETRHVAFRGKVCLVNGACRIIYGGGRGWRRQPGVQAPAKEAWNMAIGWTGDGAVQDQIQDSINDEVARARRNLPKGESLLFCAACGEEISEARRRALPGVRLCLA